MNISRLIRTAAAIATVAAVTFSTTASANPFLLFAPLQPLPQAPVERAVPEDHSEAPANFRRQVVDYRTHEAPGTIIIDTSEHLSLSRARQRQGVRYGIGVGREGFTWSGTQTITRKAEWPDWTPPAEMIARQPYLPRYMAGGPGNPLGARAMYLGNTIYRIHGTNDPLDHRRARVVGLHPPDQRRRDRPLQPREHRHQGHRAADAGAQRRDALKWLSEFASGLSEFVSGDAYQLRCVEPAPPTHGAGFCFCACALRRNVYVERRDQLDAVEVHAAAGAAFALLLRDRTPVRIGKPEPQQMTLA